jgi:hypothetical protein
MTKNTTEFDPKKLSQAQLASLIGWRPSRIRENAHTLPRNADGSYNAATVIQTLANQVEPAALSADDIERCLQSLWLLNRGQCEHTSAALLSFLDRVERAHGSAGLLAVMTAWRNAWTQNVEALPHANAGDDWSDVLGHIVRCSTCNLYRWGPAWTKANSHPDLEILTSVCWKCFGV